MRINIDSKIPLVALEIQRALKHIDVCGRNRHIHSTRDIILGADVPEAQQRGRQLRDRVVLVRDTERCAHGGVAQVLRNALEPDFRRAVGVQIDGCALAAQHGGGEGRECATKGVACSYDLVVWVLGFCGSDSGEHVGLRFEPAGPEALACEAGWADGCGDGREDEVGDPVADAARTAETQHDELVGGVGSDEASYVCSNAVFKLGQSVGGCGFDERAVSLGAREFGVGRVVVGQAVRRG
jgi:hypothetical protein